MLNNAVAHIVSGFDSYSGQLSFEIESPHFLPATATVVFDLAFAHRHSDLNSELLFPPDRSTGQTGLLCEVHDGGHTPHDANIQFVHGHLNRLLAPPEEEANLQVNTETVTLAQGGHVLSRTDFAWFLAFLCSHPSDYAFDAISGVLQMDTAEAG